MRLNIEQYRRISDRNGVNEEQVCRSTGLSHKTLSWILENRYCEVSTLEHIADALGVEPIEITMEDYEGCSENVIEWVKDQKTATLTLSQKRTVNKVKKFAESCPEDCQIIAENKDGSICAHIPVSWVKISPPKKISDSQLMAARGNLLKARSIRHENG